MELEDMLDYIEIKLPFINVDKYPLLDKIMKHDDKMNMIEFEGMKCYLVLKNTYRYLVDVTEVTEDSIKGFDKFNEPVFFKKDFVMSIIPAFGFQNEN